MGLGSFLQSISKGDYKGHPFRGNQYVKVGGAKHGLAVQTFTGRPMAAFEDDDEVQSGVKVGKTVIEFLDENGYPKAMPKMLLQEAEKLADVGGVVGDILEKRRREVQVVETEEWSEEGAQGLYAASPLSVSTEFGDSIYVDRGGIAVLWNDNIRSGDSVRHLLVHEAMHAAWAEHESRAEIRSASQALYQDTFARGGAHPVLTYAMGKASPDELSADLSAYAATKQGRESLVDAVQKGAIDSSLLDTFLGTVNPAWRLSEDELVKKAEQHEQPLTWIEGLPWWDQPLRKGDYPGHPFRGNQHVRVVAGGARAKRTKERAAPEHKDPSTPAARELADRNAAKLATAIREEVLAVTPGLTAGDRQAVANRDKAERAVQFDEEAEVNPEALKRVNQAQEKLNAVMSRMGDKSEVLNNWIKDATSEVPLEPREGQWGSTNSGVMSVGLSGLLLSYHLTGIRLPEGTAKTALEGEVTHEGINTWKGKALIEQAFNPSMPNGMLLDYLKNGTLPDSVDQAVYADSLRVLQYGDLVASRPDADPVFVKTWGELRQAAQDKAQTGAEWRDAVRESTDANKALKETIGPHLAKLSTDSLPMMDEGFRHPTATLPFNAVDKARKAMKAAIVERLVEGTNDPPWDKDMAQFILDQWANSSNDAEEASARIQRLAAEIFDRPDAMAVNEEWRKSMYTTALSGIIAQDLNEDSWKWKTSAEVVATEKPVGSQQWLDERRENLDFAKDYAEITAEGIAQKGLRYFSHDPEDGAHVVYPKSKYEPDGSKTPEYVSQAEWETWAMLGHSPKGQRDQQWYDHPDTRKAKRLVDSARAVSSEHHQGAPLRALGDAHESKNGDDLMKTMLRRTYDETQNQLAAMGFKPDDLVMLYRGGERPDNGPDVKIAWGEVRRDKATANRDSIISEPAPDKVITNPLSSWALTPAIARRFGEDNSAYSAAIPIKDIFSLSTTGPGCLTESEIVVLGGKYNARTFEIER
jgi:hypothetical protein